MLMPHMSSLHSSDHVVMLTSKFELAPGGSSLAGRLFGVCCGGGVRVGGFGIENVGWNATMSEM